MSDDGYCAAPFFHMALSSAWRTWRPCCAWDGDHEPPIPDGTDDPINHPWMADLRARMLSGERIPGCGQCYMYEEAQGHSMRLQFNEDRGRLTTARLRYLELNFGNLCNMMCRMCNSLSSSRWMAHDHLFGREPSALVRRGMRDIGVDLGDLEIVKLIGGEPSLEQDGVRDLLRGVAAARGGLAHLTVEIITNGLVPFDDDILSMLASCGRVQMQVSIDGLETRNDYQRSGGSWREIVGSARLYHGMVSERWGLMVASSVGLFTVGGITDFADWVATEMPLAQHVVQMIHVPSEQAVENLPRRYKETLISRIRAWVPAGAVQPGWLPYGGTDAEMIRDLLLHSLGSDASVPLDRIRRHVLLLDGMHDTRLSDMDAELHGILFD